MTQVKKRWGSIDALRIAAFALIFLYHFMVEIESAGYFSFAEYGISYENENLHIAKIGVVLFFMISGFGLMIGSKSGLSLKEYIQKRFIRILFPYYVVSAFVFLCALILSNGPVFKESIPKWHIIFTVLGLDGYLKEYGISTFHLGIGEWFVGCMILMYLVFPLLRKVMLKKPNLTILIATICYLIIIVFYEASVPIYYFFPVKLYDFILGMYLAMKLEEGFGRWSIFAGIAAVGILLLPVELPLNVDYPNVIFSLLTFILVFLLEKVHVLKSFFDYKIIKKIAACSYEMFLIHHWGIIIINRILQLHTIGMVFVCFAIEAISTLFVGIILHYCMSFCKREHLQKLINKKSM